MSVLTKVLLGIYCVAAIFFFYLAARTLKTHQAWGSAYQEYAGYSDRPGKIQEATDAIAKLKHGDITAKEPSIYDLEADLHKEIAGRGGRVWPGVTMTQVDPATGVATVQITAPTPHGLQEKAIVYAFDVETTPDKPGGKYLGEFRVTGVADAQITLTPTYKPSARELAKLSQAKPAWILADTPAIDRRELFAGKTADELKAILPAETVDEYVRDHTPKQETDPEENVRAVVRITKSFEDLQKSNPGLIESLGGTIEDRQKLFTVDQVVELRPEVAKLLLDAEAATSEGPQIYVRLPRDYAYIFQEMHRQIAEVEAANNMLNVQLAGLKKDLEDAAKQKESYAKQIADAKIELARSQKELKDVIAHRDALKEQLAANSAELDETLAENKKLADEYAALQLDAIRDVDALTQAAAN